MSNFVRAYRTSHIVHKRWNARSWTWWIYHKTHETKPKVSKKLYLFQRWTKAPAVSKRNNRPFFNIFKPIIYQWVSGLNTFPLKLGRTAFIVQRDLTATAKMLSVYELSLYTAIREIFPQNWRIMWMETNTKIWLNEFESKPSEKRTS